MYADLEYYNDVYGGTMDDETALKRLEEASYNIDSLTFGRAKERTLSDFQTNMLARVCCEMADFNDANSDMLNSALSSYSLNGASMSFSGNSAGVTTVNGIIIARATYEKLKQTGLTCLSLGVYICGRA